MSDKYLMEDVADPFSFGWFATKAFHRRFNLDTQDHQARRRKLLEEVGEFLETSLGLELGYPAKDAMLEEAADVYITLAGVLQSHGVLFAEFENAIRQVAEKNNQKTLETHETVNGFIRRKG